MVGRREQLLLCAVLCAVCSAVCPTVQDRSTEDRRPEYCITECSTAVYYSSSEHLDAENMIYKMHEDLQVYSYISMSKRGNQYFQRSHKI